jgi:hypothetical protein
MTLAAPVSLHFVDQQVDLVARPTADSANQPFDHVGDPGPFHQQTPLAPPRVGHNTRGSSRRAAFCARSKHPLAVRYYEYGQMEYGGLPVLRRRPAADPPTVTAPLRQLAPLEHAPLPANQCELH